MIGAPIEETIAAAPHCHIISNGGQPLPCEHMTIARKEPQTPLWVLSLAEIGRHFGVAVRMRYRIQISPRGTVGGRAGP